MNVRFATAASGNPVHFVLVFLLLAGLPVIVWLDIRTSLRRAVTEMNGHVANKPGDGLMLLFGYTVAREREFGARGVSTFSIQRALTMSKRLQRL